MNYASMLARAAGLIPLVMILVSAIKKMGLEGVWLTRASFVVGLIVGVASEAAAGFQPLFVWWFASILYGLIIGACACGAYDLGSQWFGPKPLKIASVDQTGMVLVPAEQIQSYNRDAVRAVDDASLRQTIADKVGTDARLSGLQNELYDHISNTPITPDEIIANERKL